MTREEVDQYSDFTLREIVRTFLGEKIGGGISRDVYHLKSDPTMVVKIEHGCGWFQNIKEWHTWEALRSTKYADWLAPIHDISPWGAVLLQTRTLPLRPGEAPKKLPEWLSDRKFENWGKIGDRTVCHDYGTNFLLNHGAFCGKLTKADFS